MIKVYKNFLSKEEHKEIYDTVTNDVTFPWFASTNNAGTVSKKYYNKHAKYFKNLREHGFLTHLFFNSDLKNPINSRHIPVVDLILRAYMKKNNIKKINLLRSKANLQIQVPDFKRDEYNTPHTDYRIPHQVLIYYVNQTDGDTFLFNKNNSVMKRIKPEPNKLVSFDGSINHAGSHPSRHMYRILINIDFTF